MKFTFKLSVEVRKNRQPEPCARRHADEPPEELPSCSDARIELARGNWDHDTRSPAVAARFGFAPPATARCADARPGGEP